MDDVRVFDAVSGWQHLPAVRYGRVYVADDSQYFNRPGPRLVDSLEIMAHALHPETHPLPTGLEPPVRVIGSTSVPSRSLQQSPATLLKSGGSQPLR